MSIDLLYEETIKKLTSQGTIKTFSALLWSLKTNDERVSLVYDTVEELNSFPNLLVVNKSEKVSTYYRNLGNKCFQKSEDYKAWQYYNLSLLHAPTDSDSYSLALANRSAVFYSLKKYEDCLSSITQVFSMEYPENLKEKLTKRQVACTEALKKQDEKETISENEMLKFKGLTDPRYPCASTKLEVMWSKEMGRHVIAKEDIHVGEILVFEKPYFNLLLKSQFLFNCSYCLSMKLNLLPCKHCCFSLYCSKECEQNAWKDYHSVECKFMATLVKMDFTKLELLGLRTVIKARSDHSDWNSLFETVKEADSNLDSEYRGHVKIDGEWVYDSKYYPSIHTLASNIEHRNVSDIFQKSFTAAVFLHFLKEHTDFMKSSEDNVEVRVGGMLLLHIMTSPTNMHGLSSTLQNAAGNFEEEVSLASAPYAFHSLLNHSCAPNVARTTRLGSSDMSLVALRPIKKGMQIFDNYGSHHALHSRAERHQNLKFQYKFTCLCEACVNNWPTYLLLKPASLPAHIKKQADALLSGTNIGKLQKGNKDTAIQLFKRLCVLAESLEPYAPCVQLADCQETLKQCIAILQGIIPYGYGQHIKWDAKPPQV